MSSKQEEDKKTIFPFPFARDMLFPQCDRISFLSFLIVRVGSAHATEKNEFVPLVYLPPVIVPVLSLPSLLTLSLLFSLSACMRTEADRAIVLLQPGFDWHSSKSPGPPDATKTLPDGSKN